MKARLQLPAQILEAERQAKTLFRFVLDKRGARWLVYKPTLGNPEAGRRVFQTDEAAVEYLFNKLPVIASTRGDIIRIPL